jgi:hypothetical protein
LKKSQTIKFLILVFVGICLFSFIPAIRAEDYKKNTTIRPIDHFLPNNEWFLCNYIGHTDGNALYLEVHSQYATGELISNCIHSGIVIEKVLKDGWIEFQVLLFVEDAHLFIYYMDPNVNWWPVIFEGKMDYFFTLKFRIQQEPGDPIPFFLYGEIERLSMNGQGSGIFTPEAELYGFTSGTEAKVKVNQIGLHGLTHWPVEQLFFH